MSALHLTSMCKLQGLVSDFLFYCSPDEGRLMGAPIDLLRHGDISTRVTYVSILL